MSLQPAEFDLEEKIRAVLDRERRGIVLVIDTDGSWDFAYDVNTVEIRDALLSFCRSLAAYEGDK